MSNFEIHNQSSTSINSSISTTNKSSLNSADEKAHEAGVSRLANKEPEPTRDLSNHKVSPESRLTLGSLLMRILSFISSIFSFFLTKAERDFKAENSATPLSMTNEANIKETQAQAIGPEARYEMELKCAQEFKTQLAAKLSNDTIISQAEKDINAILQRQEKSKIIGGCSDIWRSASKISFNNKPITSSTSPSDIERSIGLQEVIGQMSAALGGKIDSLPAIGPSLQEASNWGSFIAGSQDNKAASTAVISLNQNILIGGPTVRQFCQLNSSTLSQNISVTIDTKQSAKYDIQSLDNGGYSITFTADMLVRSQSKFENGQGVVIEKFPFSYSFDVLTDGENFKISHLSYKPITTD